MVDDEEDVLGSSQGDTSDAGDLGQAKLSNRLARLLLVARVDNSGVASGDVLASLDLGVGVVGSLILNVDLLLDDLIVRELFDTGVRHFDIMDYGTKVLVTLVQ